jgi:cell division protein FtsI/penicillin-binding protein 2
MVSRQLVRLSRSSIILTGNGETRRCQKAAATIASQRAGGVVDTLNVPSTLKLAVIAAGLLATRALASAQEDPAWRATMQSAARAAPQARVVVVRIGDGHLVAARHLEEAAKTLAAPGSTLKPIVLYQMLAAGVWNAGQRVPCPGKLEISGRRLACSHPTARPFDAEEALAWSCNAYFAQAARVVPAGRLTQILQTPGLLGQTGLAGAEATAEFRAPRTTEETQLAVLGVDGIRVTPLELAAAYRWLARELDAHAGSTTAATIQGGLAQSATLGIAKGATAHGASVMGKTGTAEGTDSKQTHGWFVGLAPASKPEFVLVVYLPAGHGSDAATVAGELLAHAPLVRK